MFACLLGMTAWGCSTSEIAGDGASAADSGVRTDAGSLPDAHGLSTDAPADASELVPRYTTDLTYSPLTKAIARRLRAIAALNQDLLHDDVFMKAGDSITVATQFMTCFAGSNVKLGQNSDLASDIAFFKAGDANGSSPFDRASVAAKIGWSADGVLAAAGLQPDPSVSWLNTEFGNVFPRYALVMFGTNDVYSRSIVMFESSMMTIVDDLVGQGVIPILSSVPPNDGTTPDAIAANLRVPTFNAVVRAIAQARQLPFMDFWKELEPLPLHGLGPDGVHPNTALSGPCDLTSAGLQYGFNVRNLLSMRSLARVHAVVAGGTPPDPEPSMPAVTGEGSYDKPFVISGFPFSDLRDTSMSSNTRFTRYSGCMASQDESGPEYVYRLALSAQTTVHAYVFARGPVDIDLHLLSGLDVADCLKRADKDFTATLAPGTYYFVLDTFVPADGTPRSGEYLFLLLTE